MTTKKTAQKGGSKGKAKGKTLTPRTDREQLLVDQTLERAHEILEARAQSAARIAAISPHVSKEKAEAEAFKAEALIYAGKAYKAALDHYEANHANPFALSRLAVVYEETKPGDFHMVVTLPASARPREIPDGTLYTWAARVEMLCRTLEHPNCSDAFRDAFGAIFTNDILDRSNVTWTTPTVVRVMLPLTLLEMVRTCDGVPEDYVGIFETLREALSDTATAEEVRKSVVYCPFAGAEKGGAE